MQGKLVNGTKGRIEEFITRRDARERSIGCASEQCGPRGDEPSPRSIIIELRGPPRDKAESWDGCWPLVRLETGGELLCDLCVFDVKSTEGVPEAIRHQVGYHTVWLRHAYANAF